MYESGVNERVEPIPELPKPEAAAPLPVVVAHEGEVGIVFFTAVGQGKSSTTVATVRFAGCIAHYLGEPNDEALAGHPLATRGLKPYAVFRVVDSPWVKRLEHLNRVHPDHRPERFSALTHYVYTFHDSTFECVAEHATASLGAADRGDAVERLVRDIGGA